MRSTDFSCLSALHFNHVILRHTVIYLLKLSGPGRIRTFEGARPADLQSAPVDRFGTDPGGAVARI